MERQSLSATLQARLQRWWSWPSVLIGEGGAKETGSFVGVAEACGIGGFPVGLLGWGLRTLLQGPCPHPHQHFTSLSWPDGFSWGDPLVSCLATELPETHAGEVGG